MRFHKMHRALYDNTLGFLIWDSLTLNIVILINYAINHTACWIDLILVY